VPSQRAFVHQFCGVLIPGWMAWLLLGYQLFRPMIPGVVVIMSLNVFIYIFLPWYAWDQGERKMDWFDYPALLLFVLHIIMFSAYMRRIGRTWAFVCCYVLLLVLPTVVRSIHAYVIFFEYARSESNKVLVVMIYHPVLSTVLLACIKVITLRLMNEPGSDPPESPRWYTIYAALHLALQITGRYKQSTVFGFET